jgi:transcription elongation factor Elf1
VSRISRTATFSPDDTTDRILEDLACPACGHQDLGSAHNRLATNELRIFCDGCGAFITISMSDEQATTIQRWATTRTNSARLSF